MVGYKRHHKLARYGDHEQQVLEVTLQWQFSKYRGETPLLPLGMQSHAK